MNKLSRFSGIILLVITLLVTACSGIQGVTGKKVIVSIVYGSEKQEWLEPLVAKFNESRTKTAGGSIIEVEAIPMGSIESATQIVDQTLTPTVWSPASSIYVPVINAEWRKTFPFGFCEASGKHSKRLSLATRKSRRGQALQKFGTGSFAYDWQADRGIAGQGFA